MSRSGALRLSGVTSFRLECFCASNPPNLPVSSSASWTWGATHKKEYGF